jgi:putative proteasome-type protease
MFNVARVVGDALREIHDRDAEMLKEHGHEFNANFILGGQVYGEEPRLFHIYSAGNFIESSASIRPTSRSASPSTANPLSTASSPAAVVWRRQPNAHWSPWISTIRSNLSVGPPLDLAIIRRDEYKLATHISIDLENEYFKMIRTRWGFALQEVFAELPNPNW